MEEGAVPACEPVSLDFVKTARIVATATVTVDASPSQVWQVLNETERWPEWFDAMKAARVTSASWDGIGSTRFVQIGPLRIHEKMVAWEPEKQWAFCVTDLPWIGWIAKRMLEAIDIEPEGSGSKLTYTGAIDPVPWLIPLSGLLKKQLSAAWADTLPNIDNQLT